MVPGGTPGFPKKWRCPEELPLEALTEPDLNVSAHPTLSTPVFPIITTATTTMDFISHRLRRHSQRLIRKMLPEWCLSVLRIHWNLML